MSGLIRLVVMFAMIWWNLRSRSGSNLDFGSSLAQWGAHFVVYALSGKTKTNTIHKAKSHSVNHKYTYHRGKVDSVDSRQYIKNLLDMHPVASSTHAKQEKKQVPTLNPKPASHVCLATRPEVLSQSQKPVVC